MRPQRVVIGFVGENGIPYATVGSASPDTTTLSDLAAVLRTSATERGLAIRVEPVSDMPTLRFNFLEPPSAGDVLRVCQLIDQVLRGGQMALTGLGVRGLAPGEETPDAPVLFATFTLAT